MLQVSSDISLGLVAPSVEYSCCIVMLQVLSWLGSGGSICCRCWVHNLGSGGSICWIQLLYCDVAGVEWPGSGGSICWIQLYCDVAGVEWSGVGGSICRIGVFDNITSSLRWFCRKCRRIFLLPGLWRVVSLGWVELRIRTSVHRGLGGWGRERLRCTGRKSRLREANESNNYETLDQFCQIWVSEYWLLCIIFGRVDGIESHPFHTWHSTAMLYNN